MKFPVKSLLAGNLAPETVSLVTAPSSGEFTANPVGLAQVEWPVRRRRAVSGAALRLANPCGISGVAKPVAQQDRRSAPPDGRDRI